MNGAPFLECRGLRLILGGQPVLGGIDLAVPAGALVALVGASGAGKTSLLRLINRLLAPDAGQILIQGQDIMAQDAVAVRRGIGHAVQGGGLFPHWTVADNIGAVPWLLGWDRQRRQARALELMAMLELPAHLASRFPGELSGGQASRVGLARALAASPRLLLLDEPFGALDPETRDALADRLHALHRAQGLTTLIVTHDLADALLRADLMLVLDQGRIIASGPPTAIAANPHPAVQALLAAPLAQARALAGLTP
ncbi:ATP-binding cassette domain-containing protein [Sandarakinorhabdus cyanobacteriorum]|uniref:ATP-binding cassette domain-containing protein n=1 Tax=Sandarakinorhabdus cyanobacteriorum TaxID=1981098 RepID=UPI001FAF475A|nr:ATP-binding cassette domain-containing protein [Sandarakinorhabdus cyanobacteriorum]